MTSGDSVYVVYQMGKVGSSSVYESLRQAATQPLFKVHYLSAAGLARARHRHARYPTKVPVPHEPSTMHLRRLLDARPAGPRWKVFTLVREPIARDVSAYIQMVDLLDPRSVADAAQPDVARIARASAAQFLGFDERRNYTCQWFTTEFAQALGVDVLAYPFDHERGWLWIRNDWLDIAVIRLEDLDRVFEDATKALTGQSVQLRYASARSAEKLQSAYVEGVYRQILDRIRIDEDVCERVYRSRYARHFYNRTEIDGFVNRWSRRGQQDVNKKAG